MNVPLVPLLAALVVLGACDAAPEGGWRPVADVTADALMIVPADGQPHRIVALDGSSIVQDIPAADGSGFALAGVPPFPGSRFDPVSLRRAPARRPDGVRLFVTMPFTTDAPPAAVLDYYEQRLTARGFASQRDGDVLNAALPDAHLTIAFASDAPDPANRRGEIRLRRQ